MNGQTMTVETFVFLLIVAVGGEQRRASRPGDAEPRTANRMDVRSGTKQARAVRTTANRTRRPDGRGLRAFNNNGGFIFQCDYAQCPVNLKPGWPSPGAPLTRPTGGGAVGSLSFALVDCGRRRARVLATPLA